MEPTLGIDNRRDSIALALPMSWVFPKANSNHPAAKRDDVRNRRPCGRKPSFHGISQDYFTNEAPLHFAYEAALFCVILTAVTLPLLNAANAVVELIRSNGGAF
jgi:hypothetical protein